MNTPTICCHLQKNYKGFTLIELMIAVSIVGIIASFAIPSYVRYLNQAKAAEVLVNIHEISLAYLSSAYDDPLDDIKAYDSPTIGLPPQAFSDKADLYKTQYGFSLGSYVMSGNSLFTDNSVPVVLVQTSNDQLPILHALDHILKHQHSYLTPNIIAVTLSGDLSTQMDSGTTSQTSTASKTDVGTGTLQVSQETVSKHEEQTTMPALPTQQQEQNHPNTPSQPSHPVEQTLNSECYRHPGWVKNHLHGC